MWLSVTESEQREKIVTNVGGGNCREQRGATRINEEAPGDSKESREVW